jgi:prepilin-type N-terminal cleavage/methylation domain-containing protein
VAVTEQLKQPEDGVPALRPHRDRGVTFVELLVAIVLLGTVVVATLTGLRAAIIGTEVDEDHARAYAWLQAASDEIYAATYLPCHVNTNVVIKNQYQLAVATASRPADWTVASGATITIDTVQYLSRSVSNDLWGAICASGNAGSPVYPQLIKITVKDPSLQFSATIEVIKSV